jgi:uncharacterized protein (TIGR02996 family)
MMRLAERMKNPQPPGAKYSVECYFVRALRFKPDDTTARLLFATYLHKNGRDSEASQQIEQAVRLAGDNAFTQYNAGLVYLDMKNYEKALEQAHRALALGATREELRKALKAAGKWAEPTRAQALPSAPESSSGDRNASAAASSSPPSR